MSRAAPGGGTANIGRHEYDDGMCVCPDCGEEVTEAEINVEGFERFERLLCMECFEARVEREEDGE